MRTSASAHRDRSTSNREDFLFLGGEHLVDLGDGLVGRLLDLAGEALVVVLADLVILLELLEHVDAVAAHVAHGDARGLGIFVRDLDQFLAALLVELGNAQAETCPSVAGVRPRLAVDDRLFDRVDQRAVPDLDAMSRGSGTLTVATWLSGICVP